MIRRNKEKKIKMCLAISRIHSTIGSNLKIEDLAGIIVEELVNILSCAGCTVLLIEGDKVKILAERGFSKMLSEGKLNADTPFIKYVSETKKSIYTDDISSSPAFGHIAVGCFVKSLICTPIVVKSQVKGIIALDSPDENAFAEEDFHFVELLAKGMYMAMERSLLHSQVKVLTINDSLTGCYNRKKLDGDLEVEIARAKRYNRPLSLLLIAIDWFNKYNDFHGHTKGDELLRKIAGLITRNVREVDKVYRYGEEEFVILLPETNQKSASNVASRLGETIEQEQFEGEHESQPNKKVTVSIVMADYPMDGEGKDGLLKSVASALNRVKQPGRKKRCVFDTVK